MRTNDDVKFVDRFQCSMAEFAILNRASQMNEGVTPDQVYGNLPKGQFNFDKNVITKCFNHLVEDGHLKKQGDKYSITDDGREDIQKLQPLALEVPQLVANRGGGQQNQQQRQGMTQTHTTGGSAGSNVGQSGGNVGNNPGNMGNQRSNVGGSTTSSGNTNTQSRPGNR